MLIILIDKRRAEKKRSDHARLDLRTVWWHASLIFTLSVSQMIRHKLINSANGKGVEFGFRVNSWRLNFAG